MHSDFSLNNNNAIVETILMDSTIIDEKLRLQDWPPELLIGVLGIRCIVSSCGTEDGRSLECLG